MTAAHLLPSLVARPHTSDPSTCAPALLPQRGFRGFYSKAKGDKPITLTRQVCADMRTAPSSNWGAVKLAWRAAGCFAPVATPACA